MLNFLCLAVLFAVVARPAAAQTAPAPASPPHYQYCTVVNLGSTYSSTDVMLEYGQNGTGPAPDPQLVQAEPVIRKPRSSMAALNYMSSLGWECIGVDTKMLPVNKEVDRYIETHTGYLLRRVK